MTMAFVKVGVGYQLPIFPTEPMDAKTIKGIPH